MLTRVAEKLPGASERGRGIYGYECMCACTCVYAYNYVLYICAGEKTGAAEIEQKYSCRCQYYLPMSLELKAINVNIMGQLKALSTG